MIVVDAQEGIFWVRIPGVAEDQAACDEGGLLVERCENLGVIADVKRAVVTCPHLLLINLEARTHQAVE